MKIRIGYELVYDCPQPTPMILTLSVHYTRVSDMIVPDHMIADPPVPVSAYRGAGRPDIAYAIERLVDTYLTLRRDEDESFIDAYRRLGDKPFKEKLYAAA